MKKKLIVLAVVVAVIVGLLAYYQYVPFWASIVSTGAFIAGILLGWHAKGWSLSLIHISEPTRPEE